MSLKIPIVRIPFALAIDVAKLLHELAKHIDTAQPGSRLHDMAPATRDLATQMRDALFHGVAGVTDGKGTRAGELYLEGQRQLEDWIKG